MTKSYEERQKLRLTNPRWGWFLCAQPFDMEYVEYENLPPFDKKMFISLYSKKSLKCRVPLYASMFKTMKDVNKYIRTDMFTNYNGGYFQSYTNASKYLPDRVFFSDQQGCMHFAIDTVNGYVYEMWTNAYVSKSLGEFIIRVLIEDQWASSNEPTYVEKYKTYIINKLDVDTETNSFERMLKSINHMF